MAVLALDLGGTKLASAIFSPAGEMLARRIARLDGRSGEGVGALIIQEARDLLSSSEGKRVQAIGVSVPGIYYAGSGTVWAPNLPEWTAYPLAHELASAFGHLPIQIDNDRACSILGEVWCGRARQCRDAIFVAVGTGIGAGILVNGTVLRGHSDIAGATGWMALDRSYRPDYAECGCFESNASGVGLLKVARRLLAADPTYDGVLRRKPAEALSTEDLFEAEARGDSVAKRVMENAIVYWGMATANYVSLFNPEMIIFGGGVFGPAARFLDRIYQEACRWAQPISIRQVRLACSSLGPDAALYGAGHLALQTIPAEPYA